MWGPDFAGHAEFEIGPCTIPVDFGSPRKVDPETLAWGPFVTKYLEDAVNSRRAAIAFSMHAVTIEQLMAISDAGQIMPPKSTWFEPKLRDGLFMHQF